MLDEKLSAGGSMLKIYVRQYWLLYQHKFSYMDVELKSDIPSLLASLGWVINFQQLSAHPGGHIAISNISN